MSRPFVVTACVCLALGGIASGAAQELPADQIVRAQCITCHGPGLNGAPRIGDREAWLPRLTHGLDPLVHAAIRGHGGMPARGGMPQLTDAEFRAAVVFLFSGERGFELAGPAGATAPPDPYRKVVDGAEILLGVTPAHRLQNQGGHMATMHGGVPSGSGFYHLNVTLREADTQAQVRGAAVEARVANALFGETKRLEPMEINGTTSYGNYFRLAGNEPYTVTVVVKRAPGARPVEAKFPLRR